MNLQSAISFSELLAGGPGSGCRGPNCGRPAGNTGINEGDTVRIQKPITVWNHKTGNNDTFQPGTKATVLHVLPKVGTADQMLSVNVSKKHDPEYMSVNDVTLHKSVGETVQPEPVSKSKIIRQFTSNDGSQMTVVKTPETREYDPKTLKDLANQPSRYKGKFEQIEGVISGVGLYTRLYDSSDIPARAWRSEGPSAAAKPGAFIWVMHYPDKMVIREQPYQRWSVKARGRIQWEYKNIGTALGMLKKRYGISIPLIGRERF